MIIELKNPLAYKEEGRENVIKEVIRTREWFYQYDLEVFEK